jgi:hypothetical protein
MLEFYLECQNPNKSIITLEIENRHPDSILISKDSILMDGFTSNKFTIIDTHTGKTIPYEGRNVKYIPKKIELKEQESLISELNLAEVYSLEKNHEYHVSFKSSLIIEDEFIQLSGAIIIEME